MQSVGKIVVSIVMIRPGKPHVKCDYCDSKRESSLTQKKSQKIRCSWRHVVFEGVATFQRQKQLARDIESDGIPSQLLRTHFVKHIVLFWTSV